MICGESLIYADAAGNCPWTQRDTGSWKSNGTGIAQMINLHQMSFWRAPQDAQNTTLDDLAWRHGPKLAGYLLFPSSYLLFCIPLTFLDGLSFKLRILAAKTSVVLLNGFGVGAVRKGTAIFSAEAGIFRLDVADACSGLKYLIALTAVTAVYAYVSQKSLLRKWLLFICAVPIAAVANIIRVVGIALVAHLIGPKLAFGIYHDYSGYIVFLAAILLMISAGAAMNVDVPGAIRSWRKRL